MFHKPYLWAGIIVCGFFWYLVIVEIIHSLNKY
jgi:hypothetical protein